MSHYHKKLGLNPSASKEEIKAAYRRLAKQYHPDKNKDQGAEERFIEATQAYEILTEGRARATPKQPRKTYSVWDRWKNVHVPPKNIRDWREWKYVKTQQARRQAYKKYGKFKHSSSAFKGTVEWFISSIFIIAGNLAIAGFSYLLVSFGLEAIDNPMPGQETSGEVVLATGIVLAIGFSSFLFISEYGLFRWFFYPKRN